MSELDPEETNRKRDWTANEGELGGRVIITPLATVTLIVAVLWTKSLLEKWVPEYLALGVSLFPVWLVLYRARGPRFRKYGLGRWALLSLVRSAGVSALWFVLGALWPAVFRR